jgi:hypothetical protein
MKTSLNMYFSHFFLMEKIKIVKIYTDIKLKDPFIAKYGITRLRIRIQKSFWKCIRIRNLK